MNDFILSNCNLVDLEHHSIQENSVLEIEGSIISRISKSESPAKSRIDMEGGFILPGLFSMHNNLSLTFPFKNANLNEPQSVTTLRCYKRALDALRVGITTLRTVGELNGVDLGIREMINAGWVKGPRIFAAGRPLGVTGGHGANLGQLELDGPDEFRKAARMELARGADHLKIMITGGVAKKEEKFDEPQMTREEMEAVASVVRSKGTYVTAHAGGSGPIITAVGAGVTCFEHGYHLNDEAAESLRDNDCWLVPTLSVTRSPEWMRENGFEEWTIKKAVSAKDTHLQSAKTAVKHGVKVLTGTDLPPGENSNGVPATIREIEYLREAGLSNVEALRSATTECAKLCKVSDRIGLVKSDYLADLIALPSNPLSDLKALEKISFVMKNGEVIRNDLRNRN